MEDLAFYTVYENPSDYPGKFVVRRSIVRPGANGSESITDQDPIIVCESIDLAHQAIPEYCFNIGRMQADDPVIVEVWL
jgi:hypothetical protein